MIKTNQGIIVHPRKNGHGMTMPIPKILHSNSHISYLVNKQNNGTITYKPLHKKRNPFDVSGINRKSFVNAMKKNQMPFDQGNAVGKEAPK